MEINLTELEGFNEYDLNQYDSFDYNSIFEEKEQETYWEQEKLKRKKVTFDDILTNMNVVVNNQGILQFMTPHRNKAERQDYNTYNKDTNDFTQNLQPKSKTPAIDSSVKNSYIYNKYFKDYATHDIENHKQMIPKTFEELKKMLIQKMIQRQRIAEIKSKRLIFASNTNMNINNNPRNMVASKNSLRRMNFY